MALFVFVVAGLGILFRTVSIESDHVRIRQFIEDEGGHVVHSYRSPFGPGWFGVRSGRIYGVRYRDVEENVHEAHCITGLLIGIYFTRDRIVEISKRCHPTRPEAGAEGELPLDR